MSQRFHRYARSSGRLFPTHRPYGHISPAPKLHSGANFQLLRIQRWRADMEMRSEFLTHLTSELLQSCQRRELDNVDQLRFPSPAAPSRITSPSSLMIFIKDKVIELAASRGFY